MSSSPATAAVHSSRLLLAIRVGLAIAVSASSASAQIRGLPPQQVPHQWWFSGGASAVTLRTISDGASRSKWVFGDDPLWQVRATLERTSDDYTTWGITAGYGLVDLSLEPLSQGVPIVTTDSSGCASGCRAQTELWSAAAQFRSGGGNGFHSVFEAQGGVTAFRNLRVRGSDSVIGSKRMTTDLTATLGAGFGYTLSQGLAVTIMQDFGMGWHSNRELPEGTGRTWRVRVTRASLRFRL